MFSHLIERGVTLVFTSNVPPSGLIAMACNVSVPTAIDLLEQHCEVLTLDGDTDYRLRHSHNDPSTSIAPRKSHRIIDEVFRRLERLRADRCPVDRDRRSRYSRREAAENVVWLSSMRYARGRAVRTIT